MNLTTNTLRPYQVCRQCILDTNDDENIYFDSKGVCNHCHYYEQEAKKLLFQGEAGISKLSEVVSQIKDEMKGKKYDCLIGLSGGVDSSYVAYIAKQQGLRALCVHFDNGWNSELAVSNIENIVNRLGYDLYTYVIDWEEFKDLQLAYLKASVIDIEVLTDHAIFGALFKIAKDNDIKYIIGGQNVVTEGVLPYCWTYNKKDYINIKAIHKAYGQKKLKTFPFQTRRVKNFIKHSGIEIINYLDWLPYNKEHVKKTLIEELGWRDYGGKHYESIWTRFYQGYILPEKFKVDKRKAHLSSLICSSQITKEEAYEELKKPPYDLNQYKTDRAFVLKKLGLTEEEFEYYMKLPIRRHTEFETEGSFFNYYPALKPLKPWWILFKKLTGVRKPPVYAPQPAFQHSI